MACHGCEEVSSGLLVGAMESKIFKISLGFCCFAKKDLLTLIQHDDLVKDLKLGSQ